MSPAGNCGFLNGKSIYCVNLSIARTEIGATRYIGAAVEVLIVIALGERTLVGGQIVS